MTMFHGKFESTVEKNETRLALCQYLKLPVLRHPESRTDDKVPLHSTDFISFYHESETSSNPHIKEITTKF